MADPKAADAPPPQPATPGDGAADKPAAVEDGKAVEGTAQPSPVGAAEGQIVAAGEKPEEAAEKVEESAEAAEEEEADAAGGAKQKKSLLGSVLGAFGKGDTHASTDARKRTYELTIALRGAQNVTAEQVLKVFFCISCNHQSDRRRDVRGVLPKCTPLMNLKKGDMEMLDVPMYIHNRQKMKISYKELARYGVQVDMWQVSNFTFNTYYGVTRKSFADIVTKSAGQSLILQRKLTRKQLADKAQRKKKYDVARFECILQFEEFYKFKLHCDHWTVDMSKYDDWLGIDKKSKEAWEKIFMSRKRLSFAVPPNKNVLVDRGFAVVGGRPQTKMTHWTLDQPPKMFWGEAGEYRFFGTRTDLRQTYFMVTVYYGNPTKLEVELSKKNAAAPPYGKILGKAMINFTAILEISVVKGVVKRCDKTVPGTVPLFPVGDLTGNMKAAAYSIGQKDGTMDLGNKWTKLYGPGQPMVSGTVSHLKKGEKHLIVRVKSCNYLPMSKPERGCSDPLIRVNWDNMLQSCPQMRETVRPIFNFNFYFPVRSVFMSKLKKKSKDVDKLWIAEFATKGPVRIEAWDDDLSTSEFLGSTVIDISDIINSKNKAERDMLGEYKAPKKNEDDDDDDEDAPPPDTGKQWYQQPKRTRVYDCKNDGLPLVGSNLGGNTGVPTIYFECYFYHDIDGLKEMEEAAEEGAKDDKFFAQCARKFEYQCILFQQQQYLPAFPNAVGAKEHEPKNKVNPAGENIRRFTNMVLDPYGDGPTDVTPLMRFLTPIIVPESLSHPIDKMHWIHCLTWEPTSSKQLKQGLIPYDGWKPPSFILQKRKGAAQDHALVLCSLLMGGAHDAYVVKGTVWAKMPAAEGHSEQLQLVEHVWVMTREDAGWVTFWEPMNGKMYHLPNRWVPPKEDDGANAPKKKKKAGNKGQAEAEEEQLEDAPPELVWEGEAPDQKVTLEDMESLPTTRRQPKAKARVGDRRKNEIDASREKKEAILRDRENLKIAPVRELISPENLVSYLPYDSIDVVFNSENIYANHQNHNPALIMYDFPDKKEVYQTGDSWLKYLEPKDIREMEASNIDIEPCGDKSVALQKAFDSDMATQLQKDIVEELEENLRLYRSKMGYDCAIDHHDYVLRELDHFLAIQELVSTIDPDMLNKAHGPVTHVIEYKNAALEAYVRKLMCETGKPGDKFTSSHNKHGSPFMASSEAKFARYRAKLDERIKDLQKLCDDFMEKKEDFPVKRDKELKGVTVHFCTSDVEDIRSYLISVPEYKNIVDIKDEDIIFSIQARVFPLVAGVQSVWIFVGAQMKIVDDPKKSAKENGNQEKEAAPAK